MEDSQQEKQSFELIPIPQEALGSEETEELYEVRRVWNTEEELGVLTLAELAARRMHEQNDSQGVPQLLQDAQAAGKFGGLVRQQFEELTGQPVVSPQNFLDQPKKKRKKQRFLAAEQDTLFD